MKKIGLVSALLFLVGLAGTSAPAAPWGGSDFIDFELDLAAEAGWCSLSCIPTCPAGAHRAYVEGDADEWDGGNHNSCYDRACCWQGAPICKHPECQLHEEQDLLAETLLAEIDDGIRASDIDRLAALVAANDQYFVNRDRSAIQLVTECDSATPVVHVNLPLSSDQLEGLERLLE